MVKSMPEAVPAPGYAMVLANESYNWYRDHAIRARKAYRLSESILLVVSAAIPTSAVLAPHDARVPAILGSVAVILAGMRSIFHWQDNYLRFSGAREAVEAERRLYNTNAVPYHDEATRDQLLVAAVSRIEQSEMSTWTKIATERPKSVN